MRRVLVAYDGTEAACTALALAIELAKALGADVAVVSVIPSHVGWTSTNPCDDESIHALELCEAQSIVRNSGLEPTLIQRTGDPAETIERVAEEGKYDVIVVGSRSPRNHTAGYMGDSVSEHVAAHARMTVVIAR
jgi:nucleotide-binding universal stress UspA family protein